MEPRYIKMHTTAHSELSFFHLVNWNCSAFHSLTPDAQIRTRQSTEVTVDGTRESGVVDQTKDIAHIIVTENGRKTARTARRLPLSQRVDVSLLKRVKGLPWDGQGPIRRGRPPKLVLPEPSMAETGETLRTGGSSSSGTQSSPIRPGLTDVKVDTETEWTPVTRQRRLRSKTLGPAVVEETKRLRSTAPTSRHWLTAPRCSWQTRTHGRERWWSRQEDDDEPAEKYWAS